MNDIYGLKVCFLTILNFISEIKVLIFERRICVRAVLYRFCEIREVYFNKNNFIRCVNVVQYLLTVFAYRCAGFESPHIVRVRSNCAMFVFKNNAGIPL